MKLSGYRYKNMAEYIHSQTYGEIAKLSLGKADQLKCYFDPELITHNPVGPKIDPIDCPNVIKRMFKGSNTNENEYVFHFGFISRDPLDLKDELTKLKEKRNKIYGPVTDELFNFIPQRYPQEVKSLQELTYDDWGKFAWSKMDKTNQDELLREDASIDMPKNSCSRDLTTPAILAGTNLHNKMLLKSEVLNKPKRR